MNTQRIQKLITFSPQLYALLEKKAKSLGVSFPEYIRGLAVNDIKRSTPEIPNARTRAALEEAEKEIKEGKTISFKTGKEALEYLEKEIEHEKRTMH